MQVLLLLRTEDSSHSKATKINQKDWLSHWPESSPISCSDDSEKLGQKSQLQCVAAGWGYSDRGPLRFYISGTRKCLALNHAFYTNSHRDTMWSSAVGFQNYSLSPLCAPVIPCNVRVSSRLFKSSNCGLLHHFPSVNCMQSTDSKHSVSQLEKRACTSLFCSRGEEHRTKKHWWPARAEGTTREQHRSSTSRLRATSLGSRLNCPLWTRSPRMNVATGSADGELAVQLCHFFFLKRARRTHGGIIKLQSCGDLPLRSICIQKKAPTKQL